MVQRETSVVRQRRLRAELRRIREESGRTQRVVADALGWSTSKVIRIEGQGNVSTSDVMALLHYYHVDDQELAEELLAATRAQDEGWWDEYRGTFGQQFVKYVEYEDAASRIRQYMGLVVPGLLQTEKYTRALVGDYNGDPEWISRSIRARMRRQRLLDEPTCPELMFMLDEAVIHRWIGGPSVMREQLLRIKEAAQHSHVSIRIVPFAAGMYAGMQSLSFTIFEFVKLGPVVVVEDPHGDVYVEGPGTSNYIETFLMLQQNACPEGEVEEIIDLVIDKMRLGAKV